MVGQHGAGPAKQERQAAIVRPVFRIDNSVPNSVPDRSFAAGDALATLLDRD
jgi:hypothetical protein